MIDVHSLIREESRNSACVNRREFADLRLIFIVPLRDRNNAAPTPKFEASHIASNSSIWTWICI